MAVVSLLEKVLIGCRQIAAYVFSNDRDAPKLTSMSLYPYRFSPLFRQYVWGGRRLETHLGKKLGSGATYAESWEVVDHGADQSVVAAGPMSGTSLNELIQTFGADLLGRDYRHDQFPLLFKFLDANRNLSVQVHPNDAQAATLDPPDLGKTEAWIVLAAEPGSKVYCGLRDGIGREDLIAKIREGKTEECLHCFEPRRGDCIFVPAGTVHALGAGLLIAEIQQASDTTFRLFDWNRLDHDGRPRPLHVDQALEVIDFEQGPVGPRVPTPTENESTQRLVDCDRFVVDRWIVHEPRRTNDDERFHLLAVLSGCVRVEGDLCERPLSTGQTILIPAATGPVLVTPDEPTELIDVYLP